MGEGLRKRRHGTGAGLGGLVLQMKPTFKVQASGAI